MKARPRMTRLNKMLQLLAVQRHAGVLPNIAQVLTNIMQSSLKVGVLFFLV